MKLRPMFEALAHEATNFLVKRRNVHGTEHFEECFAFEGNIYPQRLLDGVCWDDRVTDAVGWIPLPQLEN